MKSVGWKSDLVEKYPEGQKVCRFRYLCRMIYYLFFPLNCPKEKSGIRFTLSERQQIKIGQFWTGKKYNFTSYGKNGPNYFPTAFPIKLLYLIIYFHRKKVRLKPKKTTIFTVPKLQPKKTEILRINKITPITNFGQNRTQTLRTDQSWYPLLTTCFTVMGDKKLTQTMPVITRAHARTEKYVPPPRGTELPYGTPKYGTSGSSRYRTSIFGTET